MVARFALFLAANLRPFVIPSRSEPRLSRRKRERNLQFSSGFQPQIPRHTRDDSLKKSGRDYLYEAFAVVVNVSADSA